MSTPHGTSNPSGEAAQRHLQASAHRHLWLHFTRMSSYAEGDMPVIVRGSGQYVYDNRGKRYLDGLSEAAVRQRVQRLTDNGVMQIVAVTDPMMLGFHRQTMIGIKCEGDLERVADHLAGMDEIDYVVITSGSFDVLVEVVCEDDDHLLEILTRVRGVPSVASTETFVYLKLRKQTYSWGTR